MKKLLVALALAAVASTANATLFNSRHDFLNNGYMTVVPGLTMCGACHTPHNAKMSDTIIWARADFSAVSVTGYSGYVSISARGVGACLTCHATGSTADTGLSLNLPQADTVGYDLRNDHPVGSGFVLTPGAAGFQNTITLGGVSASGAMTCASCHDVHNAVVQPNTKLLKTYTTTDICVACHNK